MRQNKMISPVRPRGPGAAVRRARRRLALPAVLAVVLALLAPTPASAQTLTATDVEATMATLTIANHTPPWHYQYTKPSGGKCSAEVTGTTANVTGLATGTTYTFKAYSNSTCATELATAADFLTKPGKVANVSATAGLDSLTVRWSSQTGAASYKIQWKSSSEDWNASRQATSMTPSKLVTPLTNGTQYALRVAATNTTGDGKWSEEVKGTPTIGHITVTPPTGITVREGATASYSVKLTAQPTADVTVTVARKSGTEQDPDLSVASGATLTFTSENWNKDQTVTLAAARDDDGEDGSAVFVHTASGGGYGSVVTELTATEADQDEKDLVLRPSSLTVREGSTATFDVRLTTEPTNDVTVRVAREGGRDHDADLSVAAGSSLEFRPSNWFRDQTVTLRAAEDDDGEDGAATFLLTARGGGYGSVEAEIRAMESDNDSHGLIFSPATVTITEGTTASYEVALATRPSVPVTVTVSRQVGAGQDPGVTVREGASLTFEPSGWNRGQTVTLEAAEDDDGEDGEATLVHVASGGPYDGVRGEVGVAVSDNDPHGLVFSPAMVTVPEGSTASYQVRLATKPRVTVTVAVARKAGARQDKDLAVRAGASLTFPPAEWNVEQAVTLEAAEDDDGENGEATFTHTASGGAYASVRGDVVAAEADNDTKGLIVSPSAVTVAEGGTERYQVRLATRPTGTVTVTLSRDAEADDDIRLGTEGPLRFTRSTWDAVQTITVEAAEDDDGIHGTASFTHAAAGGGYDGLTAELTVTERDNDELGLEFTPARLSVREGDSAAYTISLKTRPQPDVTVSIGSDDAAVSVSPDRLTFSSDDWREEQEVTLDVASGTGGAERSTVLVHRASGGSYSGLTRSLSLRIMANERPNFAVDAHVPDQSYEQHQEIAPLLLPEAAGGDGVLTYSLTPAPPAGLRFDAETRTLSGTPMVVATATVHTYRAADADADGVELSFSIEVAAPPQEAGLEDALAAQGQAFLTSATNVIGYRFRGGAPEPERCRRGDRRRQCMRRGFEDLAHALALGAAPGDPHAAALPGVLPGGAPGASPFHRSPGFALAGQPTGGALWDGPAWRGSGVGGATWAGSSWGGSEWTDSTARAPWASGPQGTLPLAWGWDRFLGNRSFARALEGRWTVWGAGDVQSFDGESDAGDYGGDLRSVYLGGDWRFADAWLAGAAVSQNWVESDLPTADGGGGNLETSLTTVYPYLRGAFDMGLEFWVMAGYGMGDTSVAGGGSGATTDLTLGMAAAGARQALWEDLFGLDVAAVGGVGFLSLSGDAEGGRDLSVGVQQARLAVEVSWPLDFLVPYAQLGGRYDGGDGRTGLGVEVVGGVRRHGERLDLEARGRWLTAMSGEGHDEFGAMLRVGLKSRADGTGWRFALSPRWGAADPSAFVMGARSGWRGGMFGAGQGGAWPMVDRPAGAMPLAFESELGYGFSSPRLRGMVTPVLVYTRHGPGHDSLRAGLAYQSLREYLDRDLAVAFTLGRESSVGLPSDHQLQLSVTMWPWAWDTKHAGAVAAIATEPLGGDDAEARPAVRPPMAERVGGSAPVPAVPAPQPPTTQYVVQLLALSSAGALNDYVARHGLRDLPRTRIRQGERTLHVLLLGVYADRVAATRAANDASPRLSGLQPWVRSLPSLREAMVPGASDPRTWGLGAPGELSWVAGG